MRQLITEIYLILPLIIFFSPNFIHTPILEYYKLLSFSIGIKCLKYKQYLQTGYLIFLINLIVELDLTNIFENIINLIIKVLNIFNFV